MMLMMLAKGASIISIIGVPFLQFWSPMHSVTLDGVRFSQPYPKGTLRLVFKTARAHDADLGTPKILEKILRALGLRTWGACEFQSGLGMGSGRGAGRNGGPMMHWAPLIRPGHHGPVRMHA